MKKRSVRLLCFVAALLIAAGTGFGCYLLYKSKQPAERSGAPEILPDSGALALPAVAAFDNRLEADGNVIFFANAAELSAFIADFRLRDTADRSNHTAQLTPPKEYDFATHYIFFCYTALSKHFDLRQCYLEAEATSVRVQADYTEHNPALRGEGRLLQGYLIALERGSVQLTGASQISFRAEKHTPEESPATSTAPPTLTLTFAEPLRVGAAAARVRVTAAEGNTLPVITGALAWMLEEYRGYRWRSSALLPDAFPDEIGLEQISATEYTLPLGSYIPLTAGRQYRLTLRVHTIVNGKGALMNLVAVTEAQDA
ncbi:MAG: hypothetical protein LBC83_07145 [Oscillospiraceae bacterium]|nr:hypothetical protein [Oscillospiraceae bacterium]